MPTSKTDSAGHDLEHDCCGGRHPAGDPPSTSLAEVLDPVCGMKIDPADAAGTHEHEGTRYAFCSAHCLEAFAAHPERYVRGHAGHEPGEHVAEAKAPATGTEYTCPMHPEVVRSEPGPCPICGMALELRTITAAPEDDSELRGGSG